MWKVLAVDSWTGTESRTADIQSTTHLNSQSCLKKKHRTRKVSFIKAGTDVNAKDEYGRTPLYEAAFLVVTVCR
ncbi:hypothetical protein OAL17_00345 [bacterium]|nr:hypothetical protein [bacterium]